MCRRDRLARAGHRRPCQGRGHGARCKGTGTGVAIFGLQIARLLGARVIAISSSDQKLLRTRELGAAHGINYLTTPEWHKEAKALTDRVGVDHILDVGGAGTLERSLMAWPSG